MSRFIFRFFFLRQRVAPVMTIAREDRDSVSYCFSEM
jgi:hypothetical protein